MKWLITEQSLSLLVFPSPSILTFPHPSWYYLLSLSVSLFMTRFELNEDNDRLRMIIAA